MTKHVVTDFGTFDDNQLNTLKKGLKEISDVMTMMEASRETIKEIVNHVNDELNIPKPLIKKMAKVYHSRTYEKITEENQVFESLYESVIKE